DKVDLAELLQRGLREDAVEQRRQRHVNDEVVHPAERGVGDLLDPAAGETDEDEAEERQSEVEDVDHSADLRRPWAARAAPIFGAWRGLCFPLNGSPALWKDLAQ